MSILDNLPPLKKAVDLSDVKAVHDEKKEKPFLLACSRDVELPELELLKSYGSVLVWHESFRNIPLTSHKFDYALFDLREKTHRDALMKEDLASYSVVCIVSILDSFDDFVEDLGAKNCIRTLPARQAFKSDFDRLLVSAKIKKPNCVKALVRSLCFLRDGWPRK
jgi:hypothetical protein